MQSLAVLSAPKDLGQSGRWGDVPAVNEDEERETINLALGGTRAAVGARMSSSSPGRQARTASGRGSRDGPRVNRSDGYRMSSHIVLLPAAVDQDGQPVLLFEDDQELATAVTQRELVALAFRTQSSGSWSCPARDSPATALEQARCPPHASPRAPSRA